MMLHMMLSSKLANFASIACSRNDLQIDLATGFTFYQEKRPSTRPMERHSIWHAELFAKGLKI